MREIKLEPVVNKEKFKENYFLPYMIEINSNSSVFKTNSITGEPEFSLFEKFFETDSTGEIKRNVVYFKEDENILGFAMFSHFNDERGDDITSIVQFYILKEFRGNGTAMECVKKLIEKSCSNIRLCYQNENQRAKYFWCKVISELAVPDSSGIKFLSAKSPSGDPMVQFKTGLIATV